MKTFDFYLQLVLENRVNEYLNSSIVSHYQELISTGMHPTEAILNTATYFETTVQDVETSLKTSKIV